MEKIVNFENKPVVVYTAIFGKHDILIDPRQPYHGCDFICFTDQSNLKIEIWKPVKVKQKFPSPIIANRHFKWLPHRYLQEYEYSLYIDSNIILYADPVRLIGKYLALADIAMPHHPFRNCLYEEALANLRENKVTFGQIYAQVMTYMRLGYPRFNGLFEQNIILRKHNRPNVIKCMESTWIELEKWGNYRDQIVFPYIAWQEREGTVFMVENSRQCREFLYLPHVKRQPNLLKRLLIGLVLRKRRILDAMFLEKKLRSIEKTQKTSGLMDR